MKRSKKSADTSEGNDTSVRRNRRQALALGGAAAAAATVAALGVGRSKKARAAPGDPLILGQGNDTGTVRTWLQGSVGVDAAVLDVEDLGSGHALGGASVSGDGVIGFSQTRFGVEGESVSGTGVHGHSVSGPGVTGSTIDGPGVVGASQTAPGAEGHSESGPGVRGDSDVGVGVEGNSQTGPGAHGSSQTGPGVVGQSQTGHGVQGTSDYIGVVGFSPNGFAVHGNSENGHAVFGVTQTGVGVLAESLGSGEALNVSGKARFSTAGAGVVPGGAPLAIVKNPAVTADSHVTVTFTGNPGQARVSWVQRFAGLGFILRLAGTPPGNAPFTYLIVEPGA